jgi:5'-nucleotidase/UDP-sugar diphosphatase
MTYTPTLFGMSPELDYTPFSLNDDKTRGGFACLAPLIAARKAARETGSELQLLFRMGFDATTFGNHEFDFGPGGLGTSIAVAAKAGRNESPLIRCGPPARPPTCSNAAELLKY